MKYFLPSFSTFFSIQEGHLSVSGERMCTLVKECAQVLVNRGLSLPRENVVG